MTSEPKVLQALKNSDQWSEKDQALTSDFLKPLLGGDKASSEGF